MRVEIAARDIGLDMALVFVGDTAESTLASM